MSVSLSNRQYLTDNFTGNVLRHLENQLLNPFFISQNESKDIRITWTWGDYQRLEIPLTICGAGPIPPN